MYCNRCGSDKHFAADCTSRSKGADSSDLSGPLEKRLLDLEARVLILEDKAEAKREYHREYMREYRRRKRGSDD
jgi:hypothetical protein